MNKHTYKRLTLQEREELSRGLVLNQSYQEIASDLKRHKATISREVRSHGGRDAYRAAISHRYSMKQSENHHIQGKIHRCRSCI